MSTFTESGVDDTKGNPKDKIGRSKVPMSQIPTVAEIEIALAMYQGALKYGHRNFRKYPVYASVYIEAIKRHMAKYEAGEDFDSDTDNACKHLGAAGAGISILLDAEAHGTLIDDREFSQPEVELLNEANERTRILQDKFGTDTRLLEDRD